jgi:AraC-like DNA-binding protein
VRLERNQSFRLLRWRKGPDYVELLHLDGRVEPWQGFGNRWHYHPEIELAVVQGARGTRFVADSVEAVDGADAVLIGANVPHYWDLRAGSEGWVVQWSFPRHHGIWGFPETAALQTLLERSKQGLKLRVSFGLELGAYLREMVCCGGMARLALFWKVLSRLVEAGEQGLLQPLSLHPFSLEGTAQQQEAISRAVSFVLENYRRGVRLGELLRLSGMSRATFSRQFQRHAGKSFSAFLNEVRIHAVCRALRETDLPVGVVALEEGFNQLSFFNRIFQRIVGCTPREFRRREAARVAIRPHPPG